MITYVLFQVSQKNLWNHNETLFRATKYDNYSEAHSYLSENLEISAWIYPPYTCESLQFQWNSQIIYPQNQLV